MTALANSPLGDGRIVAGGNLRECTEEEDSPGCTRHTSIRKAKGLDSKAVILIGLPPHKDLASDYDHFSWFMAVSSARHLLAVVENGGTSPQRSGNPIRLAASTASKLEFLHKDAMTINYRKIPPQEFVAAHRSGLRKFV